MRGAVIRKTAPLIFRYATGLSVYAGRTCVRSRRVGSGSGTNGRMWRGGKIRLGLRLAKSVEALGFGELAEHIVNRSEAIVEADA